MSETDLPRIEYCHTRAEQCLARAKQAKTAERRAEFQELAALWEQMAKDLRYIESTRLTALISEQLGTVARDERQSQGHRHPHDHRHAP